jgi:hypothetical protein
MVRSLRLSLVGSLLTLTACSGSTLDVAAQGTFTADLSGAVTAQLSGLAGSQGRPGVTWTLTLITPGGENNIMMFREGAGRPEPGTYPLFDYVTSIGGAPAGHLVAGMQLGAAVMPGSVGFDTVRGTLVVTESSATLVVGTFTIVASLSRDPGSTVHVDGTFTSDNKVN